MDTEARRRLNDAMLRLRDGDRTAARVVFDAHWPPCLALARAGLHHDADAHDAAQQALSKLFAQASSFDPTRSALGWALALVTFEVRTLRAKKTRRREDDVDVAAVATAQSDVAAGLDRAAEVAAVAAAFVRLDEHDQATLRAFLDGNAAGAPAERKRRQRALAKLRALVVGPASPPFSGDDHV
jgi:DNA-directed RNA polymerase specialized sigma24 family protein